MTTRLDYTTIAPGAARPLFEMGKALADSKLEPNLLMLVQLRASQINGCAFCLALHMREAEALGEKGDRLSGLPAWRDAPWYSDRERAALEWTEALTVLDAEKTGDETYARMKQHFDERELVYLTLAITAINTWNRFNVAFRMSPEYADEAFKRLHPQTKESVHA